MTKRIMRDMLPKHDPNQKLPLGEKDVSKEKNKAKHETKELRKASTQAISPRKPKKETQKSVSKKPPRPSRPKSSVGRTPTMTGGYDMVDEGQDRSPKTMIWFLALASIFFLVYAFTSFFAKAELTVVPKVLEFDISEVVVAHKNPDTKEDLSFDFVSISGEESMFVTSSNQENLEQSATGKVVIYNDYSSSPQKLNANTRLEGTNGKIYKIEETVVVPGKSDDAPGQVEVGVYGGEVGSSYNSAPMDFKIVGFKNTPKYEAFYGRSSTPIAGGLVGNFFTISEEDRDENIYSLEMSLKDKLSKKVVEQIPEGYVLFDDALVYVREDDSGSTVSKNNEIKLKVEAKVIGFLFKEEDLSEKIIDLIDPDYEEDVYIKNIKNLSFIMTQKENLSLESKQLDFKIAGKVQLVSEIDEDSLKSSLLDKPKSDLDYILSRKDNIDNADLHITPPWRNRFPDKLKNIKIIVNYP